MSAKTSALNGLGLTETEASLYMGGLELGECLPKHLAEKSGIKRPTLYQLLPKLFEKGLFSQTIRGKRRYLVAEDPAVFLEKRREEMRVLEENVPMLQTLLRTASIKPKMILHEGIDGIKKLYVDTLRQGKPISEFLSLENIHPEIEAYAKNYYIPQRINRRIPIRIITSGEPKSYLLTLKTDNYDYRNVKTIDKSKFPIPLDCYIYGDNVSFAVYRSDSDPIGIIIRSREISTAIRSIFEFIWENAK